MKKLFYVFSLLAMSVVILGSCTGSKKQGAQGEAADTVVAAAEDEGDWIVLFNGENFDGWRGYNRQDIPKAWTIEDGAIKIQGSGRGEAGSEDGGDIIYDRKFKDFELSFEWKVSPGANSGVFYLAQEIPEEPIWKSALEYQILDNERHPDAKLGKDGNRQSASLYDLVPAVPQNAKPAGEWNTGGILGVGIQGTTRYFIPAALCAAIAVSHHSHTSSQLVWATFSANGLPACEERTSIPTLSISFLNSLGSKP